MVKQSRPPQWHLIFTGVGLFAAVVVAVFVSRLPPAPESDEPLRSLQPPANIHRDAGAFANSIVAQLDTVFSQIGIAPSWVELRRPAGGGIDTISVRVPQDLPVASVNRQLTEFIAWYGGHVVRGQERQGPGAVDLTVGIDSTVTTFFRLRRGRRLQRRTGDIAIVIDATEALPAHTKQLLQLKQPVTVAGGTPPLSPSLKERLSGLGHQLVPAVPEDAPRLDGNGLAAADVSRRLWLIAEQAANEGHAVISTQLQAATLTSLEQVLPRLERRGYRFVTLAELEP